MNNDNAKSQLCGEISESIALFHTPSLTLERIIPAGYDAERDIYSVFVEPDRLSYVKEHIIFYIDEDGLVRAFDTEDDEQRKKIISGILKDPDRRKLDPVAVDTLPEDINFELLRLFAKAHCTLSGYKTLFTSDPRWEHTYPEDTWYVLSSNDQPTGAGVRPTRDNMTRRRHFHIKPLEHVLEDTHTESQVVYRVGIPGTATIDDYGTFTSSPNYDDSLDGMEFLEEEPPECGLLVDQITLERAYHLDDDSEMAELVDEGLLNREQSSERYFNWLIKRKLSTPIQRFMGSFKLTNIYDAVPIADFDSELFQQVVECHQPLLSGSIENLYKVAVLGNHLEALKKLREIGLLEDGMLDNILGFTVQLDQENIARWLIANGASQEKHGRSD